jgi:predicted PurR-regulated permease PerM
VSGDDPAEPAPVGTLRVKPTLGSTLLVIAAIGTAIVAGNVFVAARRTIGWAFATLIVAWLLSAIIDALDKWMRRGIALLVTILAVMIIGVGTWLGIMASLRAEVGHVRTSLPSAAVQLERRYEVAAQFRLAERVNSFVAEIDKRFSASAAVSKAAGTAPVYFVNGVLLLFFLGYGPRFLAGALDQISDPDRKAQFARAFSRASIRARNYVLIALAQVIVVTAVGTLAFYLLDLPAPFILGLILGTLSAVPLLGAILGGLPAVLLAAAETDKTVIATVAGLLVAVQLVEILVVRRRVDRRTVRVGPALVLIVGLIGFRLYGVGGAAYATIALVFVLALVESWPPARRRAGREPAPTAEPMPEEPAEPEPEPEPTEPEPEPEPAEPTRGEPEPAEPMRGEPEPAEPMRGEPEPAEPMRGEPEPAEPMRGELEPAEPMRVQPEPEREGREPNEPQPADAGTPQVA